MKETFIEFQGRMHCSQTSYDEIEKWYYKALLKIDRLETKIKELEKENLHLGWEVNPDRMGK